MDRDQIYQRFGMIAVEKGFVSKDHVIEAIMVQATENHREGKHRLIGKILMENGLLSPSQLSEVLETIRKKEGESDENRSNDEPRP
ncbi:MAG: hypothetical protein ABII06_02225 [Pseudomonadota bacterium]